MPTLSLAQVQYDLDVAPNQYVATLAQSKYTADLFMVNMKTVYQGLVGPGQSQEVVEPDEPLY